MRKILAVAVAALAAACSQKDEGIEYGAPAAPTFDEQAAIAGVEATLQGTLGTFVAPSQPETAPAMLGDRLAADLGATGVAATSASAQSPKLARLGTSQALGPIDTTGCVSQRTDDLTGITTVTWDACHVQDVVTDTSGITTTTTFDVDGWMNWDPGQRKTSWYVVETMDMARSDGIHERMTATLDGATVVGDATIAAHETSTFGFQVAYPGLPYIDAVMATKLDADLGYQLDPFCITSGTLQLERTWPTRPMGQTEQTLPDQGWKFEWTGPGCGAFTVAHGS